MNTASFEAYLTKNGICWNHLTHREKRDVVKAWKESMTPRKSLAFQSIEQAEEFADDIDELLVGTDPASVKAHANLKRKVGLYIFWTSSRIIGEMSIYAHWSRNNSDRAYEQNHKSASRRAYSLRGFKQLIGRVARVSVPVQCEVEEVQGIPGVTHRATRLHIDEARQGNRRRVTGAPADFEGKPLSFADLIGTGYLDPLKPKTPEDILEDCKRAGDALAGRWPTEPFASACLVDDIGREIPTFSFDAGSPSGSFTLDIAPSLRKCLDGNVRAAMGIKTHVPLLDGSPALDMVAVMRAYERVDHNALVHGTSNWCAAMAAALRDVQLGK